MLLLFSTNFDASCSSLYHGTYHTVLWLFYRYWFPLWTAFCWGQGHLCSLGAFQCLVHRFVLKFVTINTLQAVDELCCSLSCCSRQANVAILQANGRDHIRDLYWLAELFSIETKKNWTAKISNIWCRDHKEAGLEANSPSESSWQSGGGMTVSRHSLSQSQNFPQAKLPLQTSRLCLPNAYSPIGKNKYAHIKMARNCQSV